jgi:hypothetical protein
MKNNHILLVPFGMIFLTIALVLKVYTSDSNNIDFLIGLFIGLSIALNVYFVYHQVKSFKNK